MRKTLALVYVAILATAVAMAAVDGKQLRHKAIGKRAVAGAVAKAGVGTVVNSPHQWGRGPEGFAERVGSSLGKHIVKETVQTGVAHALHEDLFYQPSNLNGTWPRVKYAVKGTFIVPRTDRPGKTVAVGRVSGNLAAGMVSQAWLPAASVGAGVASGGIGLAADVGVNVTREFLPRKHRRTRGK
jgi:hypothetical protein